MKVMMRCFGWGPSYECILYWGNTWPLEVVAWWFRKSSGVCEIVARTTRFRKIALFSATDWILVVWGQLQTSIHFGELHLVPRIVVVAIYSHVWTIRWGPSYKCILYWGNTWPLEVVAWWFKKSNGVCKIVACTARFRKIALFSATDWILVVWDNYELRFILGNSTWCRRLWPS